MSLVLQLDKMITSGHFHLNVLFCSTLLCCTLVSSGLIASADLCNPFGVTKMRSSAFPGSTSEEQPGAVSSLEGDGAALSSPAKCLPSLQAGMSSTEVQLRRCKHRARQRSDRAPLITKAASKSQSTCSMLSQPVWIWDGLSRWCLLGGWLCHRLCCSVSGPCKAAHPGCGRQQLRVVMGLKNQLDNFITINIICSYAGHGYDTNN